jgi:hypothetical protein
MMSPGSQLIMPITPVKNRMILEIVIPIGVGANNSVSGLGHIVGLNIQLIMVKAKNVKIMSTVGAMSSHNAPIVRLLIFAILILLLCMSLL